MNGGSDPTGQRHQFKFPFVSTSLLVQEIPLWVAVAVFEAMTGYNPHSTGATLAPYLYSYPQPLSTIMSILTANDPDSDALLSVVEHVFMPPKLPQEDPGDAIVQKTNVALCDHLIGASQVFFQDVLQNVSPSQRSLWENMIKMIKLARRAADVPFKEAELQGVFSNMAIRGMST